MVRIPCLLEKSLISSLDGGTADKGRERNYQRQGGRWYWNKCEFITVYLQENRKKQINCSYLSSLIARSTSGGKREKSKLNAKHFWRLIPAPVSFRLSTPVVSAFLSRERQSCSNSPGESASGGICREQGTRPQPCLLGMPQILNLPVTTITTQTTKCRFTDCFQQHPFRFTYIYTRKIRVSAIVTRDAAQDQ